MDHAHYKRFDEKARLSSQELKKAIHTNNELHCSSYKRLRNAVSMKLRKEKANYYSKQRSEKQDSRKLWKTLNELLPNKKQHAAANAPAAEKLTATSFSEFFTSVAEKLCGHFKDKPMPQLWTPELLKTLCSKRYQLILCVKN